MSNLENFHDACRAVLANREKYCLNYAVGYARAGLEMSDPEAVRVQCLYILNNMTGWRGPIASVARETFKRLSDRKAWTQ